MKDNVRSLTVVLPDGSVTRTGEGSFLPLLLPLPVLLNWLLCLAVQWLILPV